MWMCLKYIGSALTIIMSCCCPEYNILLSDGTVYNVATFHFYSRCVGLLDTDDIRGLTDCGREKYNAARQNRQYSYRILLTSENWTMRWLQRRYPSLVGNEQVCMPTPLHITMLSLYQMTIPHPQHWYQSWGTGKDWLKNEFSQLQVPLNERERFLFVK